VISIEKIRLTYEYFYRKKYGNKNYKFELTQKSTKLIQSFIQLSEEKYKTKSLGESFLWTYFVFQFNYWETLEIESFSKRIVPAYILGEKAFLRYSERDQEFDWTIEESEIITLYQLSKKTLRDLIELSPTVRRQDESSIKKIAWNTDLGFNNCLLNTTLYNKRDLCCIKCNYKVECKEILKSTFPEIYREREKE